MIVRIDVRNQKIGEPIPGLADAIYAGIAPIEDGWDQSHLILWMNTSQSKQTNLKASALAQKVCTELNSHLPTWKEALILHAALIEKVNAGWIWTSTVDKTDPNYAFAYYLKYGGATLHEINIKGSWLSVSRLPIS